MTLRECRVDWPFPVTWLANVWEPVPPSPAVQDKANYLTFAFRAYRADTVTLSYGLVIGSPASHSSSTSSPLTSHPCATSRLEHRVIVFPFFNRCAFFVGLPFALPVLPIRSALSSVSFSKLSWEWFFILALWPSVWLPWLLPTGAATGQSLGP